MADYRGIILVGGQFRQIHTPDRINVGAGVVSETAMSISDGSGAGIVFDLAGVPYFSLAGGVLQVRSPNVLDCQVGANINLPLNGGGNNWRVNGSPVADTVSAIALSTVCATSASNADAYHTHASLASALVFGNGSVSATTTTRFLTQGFESALAPTSPPQFRLPRAGSLRRLRVRHNAPGGNGLAIVYTLRINGVATALTASLASTATDASDLVNAVACAAGDLIDLTVTKAASVGASPGDIAASLEYA